MAQMPRSTRVCWSLDWVRVLPLRQVRSIIQSINRYIIEFPNSGYDPHTKDTLFTIGLQGIESGKKEEVVEAIKKTFEKASEDGFEQDRIDAIMHRTELALKNKGNNFGLNLIMALTPAANHSKTDFFQSMHVNQKVERFRKEMAMNPNYLQEKVKQYFVNNSHRLLMSMSPEEDYTNKQEEVLEAVRTRLVEKLTPGERDGLVIAGKELAEVQSLKEDLSCLPTLKVTDIVQSQSRYALQRTNRCSVPAQVSQQPTNEVAFFRAMLSTQDVPLDLLETLPLFTGILSSMGAGKFDFRQMDTLVDLTTGGLSSSVHVTELPGSCAALNEAVLISSYCLERNVDKMFELWTEIFNDLHLNDGNIDRLKTLLRMSATDSMNGLVYRGHAYAMGSSASSLQPGASIREDYGGMVALKRLQELAKLDDLTGVAGKLRSLADIVMTKNRMKVALNTTEQFGDRMLEATSNFAGSVRGDFSAFEPSDKTDFKAATLKQYFSTPFPVNYCSMSLPTVPYAHSDFAPLRILARLMSKQFLHTEIREKGGAYGGGATANSSGTFSFYSYRDPNTTKTLETFDASADWVQKTVFSQQDLDEAKLGVFQTVDEPTPPGSRGMREFLSDVDDDMFESQRRQLREVTIEDVKRVSDKYLSNGAAKRGVSVIGPEPKEGSLDESWVVQQLV
jgi:Zn-dependent M16 (insulinase) family peptidase